jgi:hypothetical protein
MLNAEEPGVATVWFLVFFWRAIVLVSVSESRRREREIKKTMDEDKLANTSSAVTTDEGREDLRHIKWWVVVGDSRLMELVSVLASVVDSTTKTPTLAGGELKATSSALWGTLIPKKKKSWSSSTKHQLSLTPVISRAHFQVNRASR